MKSRCPSPPEDQQSTLTEHLRERPASSPGEGWSRHQVGSLPGLSRHKGRDYSESRCRRNGRGVLHLYRRQSLVLMSRKRGGIQDPQCHRSLRRVGRRPRWRQQPRGSRLRDPEGIWTSLRNRLWGFRGVHNDRLSGYVAMFKLASGRDQVTPALLQRMCGMQLHP